MTPSRLLAQAFRNKRVLITGHTGFKGAWLGLWLQQMGATVAGFADGIPTSPNHFERLELPFETIDGDIADCAALAAAIARFQPEIIFHLAAQSLVRRSYADPIETYRTNLMGTLALFEASRESGCVGAIVSATTDKVYRNREWHWGYREIDELGGADPYSASKSCVELLTQSYRKSFLADGSLLLASVRAGNVIGGGDWAEDRLVPDIVRAAFEGAPLAIRNPAATRPWQHVLDPLAGYLLVGARLLAGDGTAAAAWNFGPVGKRRIEVGEIVGALRTKLPQLAMAERSETAQRPEAGLLDLDSSKAVALLGWKPCWEEVMLERTLAWYEAFYAGRLISEMQLADYLDALDQAAG